MAAYQPGVVNQFEQGGFSVPLLSDDGRLVAGTKGKVHIFQQDPQVLLLDGGQMFDLQHGATLLSPAFAGHKKVCLRQAPNADQFRSTRSMGASAHGEQARKSAFRQQDRACLQQAAGAGLVLQNGTYLRILSPFSVSDALSIADERFFCQALYVPTGAERAPYSSNRFLSTFSSPSRCILLSSLDSALRSTLR